MTDNFFALRSDRFTSRLHVLVCNFAIAAALMFCSSCGVPAMDQASDIPPQMEDKSLSEVLGNEQPSNNQTDSTKPPTTVDSDEEKDQNFNPSKRTLFTNKDQVFNSMVHSVRLFPTGEPLSQPVLSLGAAGGSTGLELHFDVMGKEVYNFYWKVLLCNHDWSETGQTFFQYAEGFEEQDVRNFRYSFQTKQSFVHYEATIPGEDLKLKRSGNYLLVAYEENNPDKPVFSKRFYVIDPSVAITGNVNRSLRPAERNSHQELRFNVKYENLEVTNPFGDMKVVISQNNRWDNALVGLSPKFVRNNELVFESEELSFPAGKEWRFFSTRSIRFLTERVKKVRRSEIIDSVDLISDQNRSFLEYRFRADMNGNYFVAMDESERDELEGDYTLVNFSLPYPTQLTDGDLYVFGALTNYDFLPFNRMEYNHDSKRYEADLLVKQGFYNYMYAFLPREGGSASLEMVEGNHFEAENTYTVMVYLRDFIEGYDRLIGMKTFRSNR